MYLMRRTRRRGPSIVLSSVMRLDRRQSLIVPSLKANYQEASPSGSAQHFRRAWITGVSPL